MLAHLKALRTVNSPPRIRGTGIITERIYSESFTNKLCHSLKSLAAAAVCWENRFYLSRLQQLFSYSTLSKYHQHTSTFLKNPKKHDENIFLDQIAAAAVCWEKRFYLSRLQTALLLLYPLSHFPTFQLDAMQLCWISTQFLQFLHLASLSNYPT